jgi:hypothetical protein
LGENGRLGRWRRIPSDLAPAATTKSESETMWLGQARNAMKIHVKTRMGRETRPRTQTFS